MAGAAVAGVLDGGTGCDEDDSGSEVGGGSVAIVRREACVHLEERVVAGGGVGQSICSFRVAVFVCGWALKVNIEGPLHFHLSKLVFLTTNACHLYIDRQACAPEVTVHRRAVQRHHPTRTRSKEIPHDNGRATDRP